MNKVLPFYGIDSQEEGISTPPSNPGLNETKYKLIQYDNTISHMKYDLDSSQNSLISTLSINPPRTSLKK